MKKVIFVSILFVNGLVTSAQTDVSFFTGGLKFSSVKSDAMYYSTQSYPNIFDPSKGGTMGVKESFADKFGYLGVNLNAETYGKGGYAYVGFAGIFDWLGGYLFSWMDTPNYMKLKKYSVNFPQGTDDQNTGGVITDVLDLRIAGGFTSKNDGINFGIFGGVHGGWGLMASYANFDEQTGATFHNTNGFKSFKGFNASLNIFKDPANGFMVRNTFMYNFYAGKDAGRGTGFKFETMVYLVGAIGIGFHYQVANIEGAYGEPWLYGDGVMITPNAKISSFGVSLNGALGRAK